MDEKFLPAVKAAFPTTGATITLGGTTLHSSGSQSFTGPVLLTSSENLTSDHGDIRFIGTGSTINDTVVGADTLSLVAALGVVSLGGSVGDTAALSSLAVDPTGIVLGSSIYHTVGDQTYSEGVSLGADAALTSDSGSIRFLASIDGGHALSLQAGLGNVSLKNVGGTTELMSFDDTGATPDSTYPAPLTFTTAAAPLPGAQPQPDLTVLLAAHPAAGVTATETVVPKTLHFYAPRPNPMTREAWFAFDLPRAAPVALEIFDLAGRRVAMLASGERGAGHYELRWAGTHENGARVKAGLYFARFATPGLSSVQRIIRLP